ncbi:MULTISPECIES: excinuclease ABC subunit UvrA [Peptostreptococcus]|uniref:excinuclease ABC subunit UvrA n=1 Tax=Peptostreptococcus TaxID=1257 RepID=UPI00242D2917|nr:MULTISPECIES: excinuclease ABC subunit UvrA [Peptostreptococcus]MDU0964312.1 excinuclease ABC subunit UvrA [Peptostreptococcus anaerobius]MDU0998123.1 excinuclease ABC subunit UvrA [Peptostreptococcus anaerobius]MDU5350265.1 excinuclease ABC subunit UvrA [Peptostreptococcus sp.]MDU5567494.1 excinuclease ABC subunit UvrA [Peptostreptococcus anaerobius]MDU5891493.1 excinuclease ABC subunit UvrA [Peptostreptococcus sp.]
MKDLIKIRGARENNLKNVDLTLPRDKFIVFTGLSGSGKSSLAFDTIYAEGQRRYVESLSSYARQFLGQMSKPNVESIEGLSPAISIDQKTTSKNPRSTVGTVTEIYDYLRLLFARVGKVHCPVCGQLISQMTVQEIVDSIMEHEQRTKIQILSPIVRGQKGSHKKVIDNIRKEGFVRVRIDGETYDVNDEFELEKNKKHTIEVIVDRIVIKENIEARLAGSVETAVKLSDGLIICHVIDGEETMYSTKFACPDHGIGIEELSPRMFSFNAPFGACDVCNGLGESREVDVDLVVPNKELSLKQGAIAAWSTNGLNDNTYYSMMVKALCDKYNVSIETPFKDLPDDFVEELLYGKENTLLTFEFDSKFGGMKTYQNYYEGVVVNLERRYRETNSDAMRDRLDDFMADRPCPKCKGRRLKPEVLAVKVGGKNIMEVTDLSVEDLIDYIEGLNLSEMDMHIAKDVVKEIRERASFLKNVGLGYLTLSRKAGTLSGGEAQRIRLATQIGSALTGVLYVLDEPSIGLHQRDNDKLIATLRNLTDLGNTLIVVEHDEDTMRAADYIVDIGPAAGIHGGEIVAQGPVEEIIKNPNSITGKYLSGEIKIPVPETTREGNGNFVEVVGAKENNLKNINVKFPLGKFTCVTGVSGSGKSTLVNEILYKGLTHKINKSRVRPGDHKKILGTEHIDKIINIDQSPIGRTPRSNPATYTGVFDMIRDLFASTNEAKARGYKKGRFSFNVKGGRCEACKGDGILKIEMFFLPDVYVPCEVCKGERYNRETLQVKYKDKSIADVLDMNVEEALEFFENHASIKRKLESLMDVGLSYIKLGQPSTQLSGGEAQRIKLATELSKRPTGRTMYILDEPTTGLHSEDVRKLIEVLQRLADTGNTVVVIEHNLDVIKTADHIIDLGPEGGTMGGTIIATGRPVDICKVESSYTGQYLKKVMK